MNELPHQIQSLIDGLLNPNDQIYIRTNYKNRLEDINSAIEKALRKFEAESSLFNAKRRK